MLNILNQKETDLLIKMIIKELDSSNVKGFILPKTKSEFLHKLIDLMFTQLDIDHDADIFTLLDKSFTDWCNRVYPDFLDDPYSGVDDWYYLFRHSYGSYKKYAISIYLITAILNFRSSLI